MAKFERLKWIPMIMEAYSEARVRTQGYDSTVKSSSPVQESSLSFNGSPEQRSIAPRMNGNRHVFNRKPAKRIVATQTAKRRVSRVHHQSPSPYYSVIRELRDAKQKLRQLETIQVRLNELQSTLDQRLAELTDKVTPPKPDPDTAQEVTRYNSPRLHDDNGPPRQW